ncbi:hypothetical protein BXY41_1164 [Lacrimispora xylanisolvens]|uniref:Uncharacterized protein n=2 Tax=Lacrimispora xylanisolvens TaxID=384636 RepID=A0A2S6HJ29_9FIRM|nr:hypothetical protein BXY41_1164 [Hungatella xylanolytica]
MTEEEKKIEEEKELDKFLSFFNEMNIDENNNCSKGE